MITSMRGKQTEKGIAMILVSVLLGLFSLLALGMFHLISSETQTAANEAYGSEAFYAATAGLEKMTNDLNKVYLNKTRPDSSDFAAINGSVPTMSSYSFTEYKIDYNGTAYYRTIPTGAYEGLVAEIQPYKLQVTARHGTTKAEARVRRDFLTNMIPLFQFGIFYEKDLEAHAGPAFDFGGRVHTNGSLYVTSGSTTTFRSRVTVGGEVIRDVRKNGDSAGPSGTPSFTGKVLILDAQGVAQELKMSGTGEGGSCVGGTGKPYEPPGSPNAPWTTYSPTKFGGNLLNYQTGAKQLKLPIQLSGFKPIELIKRGKVDDPTVMVQSRYFYKPGLRITLSDQQAQVPGGGGCNLGVTCLPTAAVKAPSPFLNGKFLKVEVVTTSGSNDVTQEFLNFGITVGEPDAIIRLQRGNVYDATDTTTQPYPINFYDMREGEIEDDVDSLAGLAGVMGVMEIDVNNLGRWLTSALAGSGSTVPNNNGYVVYTSDRRSNINFNGYFAYPETQFRNGLLDPGEDLAEDGIFDASEKPNPVDVPTNQLDVNGKNTFVYTYLLNDVTIFRRALRLVNGATLLTPLTISTENPLYVLGDYNLNTPRPASLVCDTITALSAAWNDKNSYNETLTSRVATSTTIRAAIITGANRSVYATPRPPYNESNANGGVHNLIRFLENWGGKTLTYAGSLINLYYSRQNIGQYKCCKTIYSPPSRNYKFDVNFLDPGKLPPVTPHMTFAEVQRLRQELIP